MIELLAIGDGVDLELLDVLAAQLARNLGDSCHVRPNPIDAAYAFDPVRRQHNSTAILARLAAQPATGSRLLGIAAVDLFVPIFTFVFGEAQLSGRCAVVSIHRLREEFYGLPRRPDLVEERLLKEALHELGHTFGVRHCDDWECAMASSHDITRLDLKSARYCSACRAAISALPF